MEQPPRPCWGYGGGGRCRAEPLRCGGRWNRGGHLRREGNGAVCLHTELSPFPRSLLVPHSAPAGNCPQGPGGSPSPWPAAGPLALCGCWSGCEPVERTRCYFEAVYQRFIKAELQLRDCSKLVLCALVQRSATSASLQELFHKGLCCSRAEGCCDVLLIVIVAQFL